nr:unnamed protein product [Callosobruchus analis]
MDIRVASTLIYYKINIDYEKISYALIGSDWRYDSVDTNEVFNNFLKRMTSALNETCPLIYQNVKFNHKAWFNDTTKTAIYNKKLAYHRFKMDKTANNWQIYQRERNICLSVLRKAKSKYYEEKIDNARSSSTSMWKTLKSIVSTKSSAVIETVLVNNLENIFNNFFIESIDVIVQASKANNKMFVFNEELMFTKHSYRKAPKLDVTSSMKTLGDKDDTSDNIIRDNSYGKVQSGEKLELVS